MDWVMCNPINILPTGDVKMMHIEGQGYSVYKVINKWSGAERRDLSFIRCLACSRYCVWCFTCIVWVKWVPWCNQYKIFRMEFGSGVGENTWKKVSIKGHWILIGMCRWGGLVYRPEGTTLCEYFGVSVRMFLAVSNRTPNWKWLQ